MSQNEGLNFDPYLSLTFQKVCQKLCENDLTHSNQSHPPETLKYYIEDSEASVLVLTKEYAEKVSLLN